MAPLRGREQVFGMGFINFIIILAIAACGLTLVYYGLEKLPILPPIKQILLAIFLIGVGLWIIAMVIGGVPVPHVITF